METIKRICPITPYYKSGLSAIIKVGPVIIEAESIGEVGSLRITSRKTEGWNLEDFEMAVRMGEAAIRASYPSCPTNIDFDLEE